MSRRRRPGSGKRKRRKLLTQPGAPPGTIVAAPDAAPTTISLIGYGPGDSIEKDIKDAKEIKDYVGKWPMIWVNVEGLGHAEVIETVGEIFSIHPLALEDVINVHERAKLEEYGDCIFIVLHMMGINQHVETEQLAIYTGKNFVVTFQEGPIDVLTPARDRIKRGQGRVRQTGSDFLTYSLLDAVLDSYFPILEEFGEMLDELEDEIIERPTRDTIGTLHSAKRELLTLRRAVWPVREAINSLIRDDHPLFTSETRLHLRDCYDHAVRIIDFIETYRELAADLMDVYLSSLSNRMNEVMKVLTIITTLFVPPTLIAGIYGMNFNTEVSPYNMPELNWYYGYPFSLGLMLIVSLSVIGLLAYKGWLGALGKRNSSMS